MNKKFSIQSSDIIRIIDCIKVILIIGAFYFFLHLIGVGCPIRFLTGIPCPGCGMSRAWNAVFHFRLRDAYLFHPLFPLPAIVVTLYFFTLLLPDSRKLRILFQVILWGTVMLFIVIYILRLLNPNVSDIKIHLSNGLIYKILKVDFLREWLQANTNLL